MGRRRRSGKSDWRKGIIQGDAFSPLLFVLMIDPLIKIMMKRVDDAEILKYMDDLKVSTSDIQIAQKSTIS